MQNLNTYIEKKCFLEGKSVTDFEVESDNVVWVSTIEKGLFRINLNLNSLDLKTSIIYEEVLLHKEDNKALTVGDFYQVEITDSEDYDLFGIAK